MYSWAILSTNELKNYFSIRREVVLLDIPGLFATENPKRYAEEAFYDPSFPSRKEQRNQDWVGTLSIGNNAVNKCGSSA